MSESPSWVQQIYGGFDKLTDILNVGRLVFYTAAGTLVVYPFAAVCQLLQRSFSVKLKGEPLVELVNSIALLPAAPAIVASTVVGFLVAALGYAHVVQRLEGQVAEQESTPVGDKTQTIAYQYPWLRNRTDEDYHAWLVQEYFRYIEIVVYIPLGLLIGLGETALFTTYYMLYSIMAGCVTDVGVLSRDFLLAGVGFVVYGAYLWPHWWCPHVALPVVRAFYRAKCSLIAGVHDKKKESETAATTPKPPSKPESRESAQS
jgi:hypothetical protein